MELFGPIEANNNGQMVPQARSIWEGNDTNAAAARNCAGAERVFLMTAARCVAMFSFNCKKATLSLEEI